MSWQALGGNPVPGDPAAVRQVAAGLGSVGVQAETLVGQLRNLELALQDAGTWRGPGADRLRTMLGSLGQTSVQMAGAHHDADQSVRRYASALEQAQDAALRAERAAEDALARAEAGRRDFEAAQENVKHLTEAANAIDVEVRLARGTAAAAIGANPLSAALVAAFWDDFQAWEAERRQVQHRLRADAQEAARQRDDASRRWTGAEVDTLRAKADAESAQEWRRRAALTMAFELGSEVTATGSPPIIISDSEATGIDYDRAFEDTFGTTSAIGTVAGETAKRLAALGILPQVAAGLKKIGLGAYIVPVCEGIKDGLDWFQQESGRTDIPAFERVLRAVSVGIATMVFEGGEDLLVDVVIGKLVTLLVSLFATPLAGAIVGLIAGIGAKILIGLLIDCWDDIMQEKNTERAAEVGSLLYQRLSVLLKASPVLGGIGALEVVFPW